MNITTTLHLNNGVNIPVFGLGVFKSPAGSETQRTVQDALTLGYRHVDTAHIYGNEADVGLAVRAADIPRSEIFVTTKLWETDQGYDSAIAACHESLRLMGLDYVDLYLIHWPVPGKRLDSWRALETLLDEGICRSIGVSNYMVRHLEELLSAARVVPAVNQIELSPYLYGSRHDVVSFCEMNAIAIEAYSPLTKGRKLNDPRLLEIAAHYDKTAAQVLIRWALEKGFIVLPKSNRPERIRENADVFDFSISADDMAALDSFDEGFITSWDPTNAP